jgi:hypothetical protein
VLPRRNNGDRVVGLPFAEKVRTTNEHHAQFPRCAAPTVIVLLARNAINQSVARTRAAPNYSGLRAAMASGTCSTAGARITDRAARGAIRRSLPPG